MHFAALKLRHPRAGFLHYRRRPANTGFKAGNLREFAERTDGDYDHMIVLDADSLMSAAAMLRLVRVMQANPRLGILQTLVTGQPAESAFARIFQFGMRHSMRTHTIGIAWWQGPSGPYWGHNAIIRLQPFIAHCRLPVLPGRPPLGGPVLSHDQVEAALMRAAGYEVRVIADEFESWEENPPSLPDFIKRDLRWCQGNMQYLQPPRPAGAEAHGALPAGQCDLHVSGRALLDPDAGRGPRRRAHAHPGRRRAIPGGARLRPLFRHARHRLRAARSSA